MKKTLKTTLALAAVALAAQASAQITFYEREGFQGESFTTRRQVGDFNRFGFNDAASSAVVAGESWERWQVCEDVRFSGRCVVLSPGQYPNLRAMGLNNRISSVQAMAREAAPPAPVATAAPGSIVVYERESFGGRSLVVQDNLSDLSRTGFNDRISSVEVIGGPWEVCRDGDFAGACFVLQPGRYPSLGQMGLDNRVSSVRAVSLPPVAQVPVAPRVVFYEAEGFGGRSFTTQGDVADFRGTALNNRASSVDVAGGWVEVCQDPSYAGQCAYLRPGKYPSLASMGLNNRISSVRAAAAQVQAGAYQGTAPVAGFAYDARRRGNEPLFEANVVAVRAIVGTPEQRCWLEREQVQERPRSNVGGAIAGALIGGILGHQVGDGRGRDLATVGGAIAGGAVGSQVNRDGRSGSTAQDVQRCTSMPSQATPELYDVTYNFRGQDHRVQMTAPPAGPTILVNGAGEPRI